MASIGPQLPPHLTKRKRNSDNDDDDDATRTSPRPNKATMRRRKSDDSSDDGGPSAAAAPAKKPAIIGPTLPPQTQRNDDEIALGSDGDDDDDEEGPAPPPKRSIGPSLPPPGGKDKPRRPVGPALPSPGDEDGAIGQRVLGPTAPPAAGSGADSDSDESDYGPAPPTAADLERTAARLAAERDGAPVMEAPKRDEWMIVPPTATPVGGSDPTKVRARKFASGPRAAAGGGGRTGEISSIWTETADQKRKRLADAVLGRGPDPSPSGTAGGGSGPRDRAAEERDAKIRANMEATRGKSLYDQHQAAIREGRAAGQAPEEEEDDPSKRAFDREKDMGLGSKINHSQRKQLLTRAADFGGRFQKGSYL